MAYPGLDKPSLPWLAFPWQDRPKGCMQWKLCSPVPWLNCTWPERPSLPWLASPGKDRPWSADQGRCAPIFYRWSPQGWPGPREGFAFLLHGWSLQAWTSPRESVWSSCAFPSTGFLCRPFKPWGARPWNWCHFLPWLATMGWTDPGKTDQRSCISLFHGWPVPPLPQLAFPCFVRPGV